MTTIEYGGPASGYEFVTLRKLQDYCYEEPEGRVVYFHTKGATYGLDHEWTLYDYWWRKFMEHFVLDLHHTILSNDLSDESPYVAAGVKYRGPDSAWDSYEQPHYCGNFWIAKCAYIRTLPEITSVDAANRVNAEMWLGSGEGFVEKHKDCWSPRPGECVGTYSCRIPEETWKDFKTCGRPEEAEGSSNSDSSSSSTSSSDSSSGEGADGGVKGGG